ncbi:hypothetical protein FRB95_001480 [Tulasnella sp. JGI-2019a]|nr:hypothetical protein FRB93_006232 [Tulasnella sp. JGI-2019a]KAG9032427.1 hypothetical protein FRB95_001480 [Tulasnella sp. JGI-2019a]
MCSFTVHVAWLHNLRTQSKLVSPPIANTTSSVIFLKLPLELNLEILAYIDINGLLSLLQTCQAMKNIVEARLYAHITIKPQHKDRVLSLLRTLSTRHDLAERIITFKGHLFPQNVPYELVFSPRCPSKYRWWKKTGASNIASTLSSILTASFQRMVNLKSMTIEDFNWLWTYSHPHVAPALANASLTSLNIHGSAFTSPKRVAGMELELATILKG